MRRPAAFLLFAIIASPVSAHGFSDPADPLALRGAPRPSTDADMDRNEAADAANRSSRDAMARQFGVHDGRAEFFHVASPPDRPADAGWTGGADGNGLSLTLRW